MIPREEQFIKEALRRKASKVKFASIFGSYGKEEADRFSDVDILIICEDEADKTAIPNYLRRFDSKIKRSIHVNILTRSSFEERIKSHDYLLASILDESRLIFGDEDFFSEQKRRILTGTPTAASIEFNRRMGLKVLDHTNDALGRLLANPLSISLKQANVRNDTILKYLRDFHVGLGYMIASVKMVRMNSAMTLRRLLAFEDASLLSDLILREKETLRRAAVNLEEMRSLLDYSRRLLASQDASSCSKVE